MKCRNKAVIVTVAMVLMIAPVAAAAPGLTVNGDPKAWAEIEAAFAKFATLKAYRAQGTLPGGGSMTMEVVPPDHYHNVMTTAGAATEMIIVGHEVRMRTGGGSWICPPGSMPTNVPTTNFEKMSGEVTAARGPMVVIDGVTTQTYTYSLLTQGVQSHFKVFVASTNGLIKRMQILDDTGAVQGTWDYFDYNAPITINLPSCP